MAIDLSNIVLSIGALGTASFALVDSSKILRNGGVSNRGFHFIEAAVGEYLSGVAAERLSCTLHGHWINGVALADQKAIAKSLIKLQLTPDTAAAFANATQVDPQALAQVAHGMVTGEPLTPQQSNALGRFDLALTARLDEAYQRADQRYRNTAKVWAAAVAVVLAIFGGWSVLPGANPDFLAYITSPAAGFALLCGLLATPLAPVSKDLASALQAGVKVAQSVRR